MAHLNWLTSRRSPLPPGVPKGVEESLAFWDGTAVVFGWQNIRLSCHHFTTVETQLDGGAVIERDGSGSLHVSALTEVKGDSGIFSKNICSRNDQHWLYNDLTAIQARVLNRSQKKRKRQFWYTFNRLHG